MSYYLRRYSGVQGLGDLASTIKTVVSGTSTALDVAADPYLPEIICRTQQLIALENKRPVPACANSPGGQVGGIGLRKIVYPLRGMVYAEEHPWVYPVAAVAAIGVPVLIGYMIGRATRAKGGS